MSYHSYADLGGQDVRGAIIQEPEGELFHASWEPRVMALVVAMGPTGLSNIDMNRAARETLPNYRELSYYEIWLAGLEKLLSEKGVLKDTPPPPAQVLRADLVAATDKAINAVKARGRSDAGQKTLLDVLVPVQAVFAAGGDAKAIATEAAAAAERTTPMLAIRGRASFLGERSIGHMDPGSRSASLLIGAAVKTLEFEAAS